MNTEELRKIVDKKGIDWLIAAMVDGSIGYHSPNGAKNLIERALKGETNDWCERCLCCYKGDLMAMIESDVQSMLFTEKYAPEIVPRLVENVRQIMTVKLSPIQEMTMSALYPTMGV